MNGGNIMKKVFILFILMISLLLVACSDNDSNEDAKGSTDQENEITNSTSGENSLLEKIKEEGVINVGTEGTYAPFSFHDDSGDLTGYDIDVVTEVADRLGVEVHFNETQWDAIFAGLDAERFDVIANQVGINEERLEKYAFSEPYTRSSAVLLIHAENEEITSFEDIDGKVSAQTLTSNYAELAETYGAVLEKVDGFNQAVDLVISKRVDGTFNDKISALDFIQQRPDAAIKIIDEEKDASENAFLFRQGNDELVEEFDRILAEMKKDGTLSEISEKWFGEDVF